jgi:hypothetical protein
MYHGPRLVATGAEIVLFHAQPRGCGANCITLIRRVIHHHPEMSMSVLMLIMTKMPKCSSVERCFGNRPVTHERDKRSDEKTSNPHDEPMEWSLL